MLFIYVCMFSLLRATFTGKTPAFNIEAVDMKVTVAQKVTVTKAELAIIDREQDAASATGKA